VVKGAEKLAIILLGILLAVSFINRGQFKIGSGPGGAELGVGYYGAVK
jgi:hypothetical protein